MMPTCAGQGLGALGTGFELPGLVLRVSVWGGEPVAAADLGHGS